MLKKLVVFLLTFALGGFVFADNTETKPESKEKKENYGQQRSSEVNKGQQGAKMKAQNQAKKEAKKKAKKNQKKAEKKGKKSGNK